MHKRCMQCGRAGMGALGEQPSTWLQHAWGRVWGENVVVEHNGRKATSKEQCCCLIVFMEQKDAQNR